ncbi:MAG: hypothetical protein IKU29_05170 [Parabacteroides sp.]|nr:hypothetical protein [Parabacteroides sp.]
MSTKYLDYSGVEALWAKIKAADAVNNEAINKANASIEEVKSNIGFEASTYTEALQYATQENIGKNVIIHEDEGIHQAGPYIITGEGLLVNLLCDTEQEVADLVEDVTKIENRVDVVEGTVNTIGGRLIELGEEIDVIGLSIQTIEKNVTTLVEKDVEIQSAIDDLRNTINNLKFDDYYIKSEVDAKLDKKLNIDAIITKEEIERLN